MRSSFVPVMVLLGASTLWGLTWLPLKRFGEYGIEGPMVTLVAHGSVGVLALPLLFAARRSWLPAWRGLAVIAASGGLANLAFATAMQLGDVTRVMALFYLLPAWGVLLARAFLNERIDAKRALSLGCALSGAFLVLGGGRLLVSPPSYVDGLAVVSGLALAVNNVVFRKLSSVPIAPKVSAVFAGSLLWALAAVLLASGVARADASPVLWLEVVAFGCVWILAATAGTLYGVNHLEAGRSSVLIIMELVTAVVSSAVILRQIPDATSCAGGVLVLSSALIEAMRRGTAPARVPGFDAPV